MRPERISLVKVSREFQIFAKPIGALCNLDCSYCYYLKKQNLYSEDVPAHMPDDLLEDYIVQHIQASRGSVISFSWHGGEPTLLGLDYFRRIVALQRKHQPAGYSVKNGIQTNGVLIDDEWCRFLAPEGFSVGLSIDGPQEMHDRYRVTKGLKPSHRQVLSAFRLLRRFRIPCDILCAVHDQNVRFPLQVYRFFREIGAEYVGFLPIVKAEPGSPEGVSPETVPARPYGEFLCTIFDEWVRRDIGRITLQMFEEASRPALGLEHSLCIFRETCGDIPCVERNGDFFCCDHYVDSEHRIGNIRERMLADLIESPEQITFGMAKRDRLTRFCRECRVLPLCNGGCPKDRFVRTPDGEEGLNYLCPGLKMFFLHALPYMSRLGSLMREGRQPEELMQILRAEAAKARLGAGRNDPCPCGSGLKYKKCCLAK